jgi:hypothetical protein
VSQCSGQLGHSWNGQPGNASTNVIADKEQVLAGSHADYGKFVAEDTEKRAKVIKFAGIKAD